MDKNINIGIWVNSEYQQSDPIQIHVNFWKLSKHNILDFGIKFNPKSNANIYIFIKGINKNNLYISDITNKLIDKNTRNLIFNEMVNIEKKSNYFLLKTKEILLCAKKNNIQNIIDKKNNPIFIIKQEINKNEIDNLLNNNKEQKEIFGYIRFRLSGIFLDNIIDTNTLKASNLESYTSKLEFIDFRINNYRSLQNILYNKINFSKIKNIRCLFMIRADQTLTLAKKEYKKVRLLEKNDWFYYLEDLKQEKNNNFLAYQWNDGDNNNLKEYNDDFTMFIEIHTSEITIKSCIIFIVLAISLGMISSAICGFLGNSQSFICSFITIIFILYKIILR